MKKNRFWGVCLSTIACLAALPAHAIVIFTGEYEVGHSRGATGVNIGDTIQVSAFYDPQYATLLFQDHDNAMFSFAAEHAGVTFTFGDMVWRTTGPLTLDVWVQTDRLGRDKTMAISLLGYTRAAIQGMVTTTLETPWSPIVTGQEWLSYGLEFAATAGLDANETLAPRLYTEADIASLLTPISRLQTVGSALAETASGTVSFNLSDPNYVQPVVSVPEPNVLMLFGMGLVSLAVFRKRSAHRANASAA